MCFKSLISYGFTLPLALMNGYISLALFVYLVTIKFLFTTERDLQKKCIQDLEKVVRDLKKN